MSLTSFVQAFYPKSDWTVEEGLDARRGFVSAFQRGWTNADGTQQSITLVRFATPTGAQSAFDGVTSAWKREPKPVTMLADPAIDAVGWSSPTLDSLGFADAEFGVVAGGTMILVVEYTAATPDPAAAKALLQQQYHSLKKGS